MENKGEKIESDKGEIPLPEAMIQHIQSYLSGKEAARTTVLSRSWYSAWLTRPVLDFDSFKFPRESWPVFEEFAKKTMQRYQGSSLKIERFRLRLDRVCSWNHDLIVNAINIGATDVELDFPSSHYFTLPKEVLGSQTLLRLSLSGCGFDASFVSCSRLRSLKLRSLKITDAFQDIILCCGSIEELSVSCCFGLTLSRVNPYKLPKLRRLVLSRVDVDSMFFTDFAYRFPCLKDLTIHYCRGFTRIHIITTSLEIIRFIVMKGSWRAKFDVPNIRKFTFSGSVLPSQLSIKGGSTEWELDISIDCQRVQKLSWFLNLKKSLAKFRLCRISVSLNLYGGHEHEVDIEVLPRPLVVENLMINAPSSLCRALVLLRSFVIFRPKFITDKFCSWRDDNTSFAVVRKWLLHDVFIPSSDDNESLAILCKRLMQIPVAPNSGIPDQDMFGKFGLKKVNVFDKEGRPLMLEKLLHPSETPVNDQNIRLELIWD